LLDYCRTTTRQCWLFACATFRTERCLSSPLRRTAACHAAPGGMSAAGTDHSLFLARGSCACHGTLLLLDMPPHGLLQSRALYGSLYCKWSGRTQLPGQATPDRRRNERLDVAFAGRHGCTATAAKRRRGHVWAAARQLKTHKRSSLPALFILHRLPRAFLLPYRNRSGSCVHLLWTSSSFSRHLSGLYGAYISNGGVVTRCAGWRRAPVCWRGGHHLSAMIRALFVTTYL